MIIVKDNQPGDAAELRKRAEEIALEKTDLSPETLETLSPEEIRKTLHELRVHQIELDIQNEELRRADAALSRYFDIYDLSPVAYFIVSEKGLILEANLTAATLLGSTRNALVKLPITQFILKEDQDIYYLHRKQLIETGMPHECDLRILENDGSTHWVHLAANVFQDADGASLSCIVMSDITERKRAEGELQESEERFRKLFEGHSAIKLVIDSETGSIIDANEASAQFYGWTVEELKQMRIQQISLLPPEDVNAEMKKNVSQESAKLEFRHRRADGTIRDVEVYCNNIKIAGKNLLYSIIQDITDRKQFELLLRESEAQFRTIFEVASVGIVQVDPINGRILQCNETYCQITGYSLSELLEVNFPEITHPEDRQRDWEIFSRAMKGEIPAYFNEKRYIRKDGSTIWVRLNAAFIRDSNGQAIRTVAICEDITERKLAEQSLDIARNLAINEKKRLEAVMEALPVGIAIVDERGGIVRSNKIYEELWGSPRPSTKDVVDYEAYKARWLDTGKPVQTEEWASAQATLKGEPVFGQMMEIESFDGVRKIVMNSAAPVYDADGRNVGSAVAIHDISNIKCIEQEVLARASELEAVFSAQNDAVLMYDTDMNVKQVNQAFLSKYGFDPFGLNVREIIRRLSCRRLDGQTLLPEEQPTPRALRGEKVTSSIFVITLPDGSDRFIETSSGPMCQGDRITGTVTVWHDITEFKRAEEKQREIQERLILAADAGQVGMFDLNMESGELQWTQQQENIFGFAPTSTTTKRTYQDWSERVHPEDLPLVEAHMRHAMEEKVPFEIEYRLIWPDKNVHWVNTSSKYYFDDGGHCKRLMGAVKDITKRKQSEERLNELSQRLTYHVDNSPLAVIEWGPDMRLTRWSNMAERIFGWKAEEVIGKRMEDFCWIYVEDMQQVEDVSTALQTGSSQRRFSSNRNYRKDGTVVHCEWYNSSLLDESGKLLSIMSLALDVTERKQAEKKIKESLAEKEVLLKEVHHRVKNNMQIIASLISLQADCLADEQLQGVLGDVRDRVRAMALVHDKLYQTDDLARLDFAEYVSSLLKYLWSAHSATSRNLHLNMSLIPLILPVNMALNCGLILNELASNAIKHAFPGVRGGEVVVTLEHNSDTGAVCLRVRDDGIGLPADLDLRQCASLGLRLVQMLAGQMRGTVQTGLGSGTEFQICFNVKEFHD